MRYRRATNLGHARPIDHKYRSQASAVKVSYSQADPDGPQLSRSHTHPSLDTATAEQRMDASVGVSSIGRPGALAQYYPVDQGELPTYGYSYIAGALI